ncbi:MAG: putative endonuclease lcl3 [Cirrosporium novae-zelandiae]|nr:MAG: putative endonuclease lcl3 [Cirrosporium novae-zelandiae]
MQWPEWVSNLFSRYREDKKESIEWDKSLNRLGYWRHYTDPQNLVPIVLATGASLFFVGFYRSYLRRIPGAAYIQPGFFRRRSLFGKVTTVGDGDNFRLFHTPGGRLAGWGWLPWRKVPTRREDLKDRTISVRLAGIDAPEQAHFGKPAQPYSREALEWLTSYIRNRRVRAYVYRRDQYERVVATVYVRRGLLRRDVGYQMLKEGLATVYEAKQGAEFGTLEAKYREAEARAKRYGKGMWAGDRGKFESPRDFKTRMKIEPVAIATSIRSKLKK